MGTSGCQLQEKCLKQRQELYLLFIDLTKVFDTVSRPGFWSILSKLGCSPKFISMVRSLHDAAKASGLAISIKKTEVPCQPAPGTTQQEPSIKSTELHCRWLTGSTLQRRLRDWQPTTAPKRLLQLDAKRQARKEKKIDLAATVACPLCGYICASAFGLWSHRRSHRRRH
ncbi:hypothetical protein ACOMHN_047603 [Nucella lapillus]